MCLRFSGYSQEEFTGSLRFSQEAFEFPIFPANLKFSAESQEEFLKLKHFSNNSEEIFFSQEEVAVQFPETGTSFDPPDPEEDLEEDVWPEPEDPSDPVPPPLPPGVWPLKIKDQSVATSAYWIPEPTLKIMVAGVDVAPYALSFNVRESRGGPCSGAITCRDRSGYLAGALSTFTMSNALFYANNKTFDRTVTINFTQKGVKSAYPTFVLLDPEWDSEEIVTINFIDGNALLDLDNQSIQPDTVASEGDVEFSNEKMRQLALLANVKLASRIPDYRLNVFRFSGSNVSSGIDTLCKILQGYRIFRGDTCYIESLKEKPARWNLTDRLHIESLTGGFQTDNLRTYFTGLRTEDQPSYLADPITCVGGQCVGRVVNISFDYPSSYAFVFHKEKEGIIQDGVFYDELDRPLNNNPSFVFTGNEQIKAVRWEGTFVPRFSSSANGPTAQAFTPQWTVWAIGGAMPSNLLREDFIRSIAATTVEAVFGRRPEISNFTSELIYDNETLELMLQAVVKEVEWSIKRFSLQTPFVNPLRAGDFVKVKDKRLQVNDTLLVNGWQHSWSTASGFSCNLELNGTL